MHEGVTLVLLQSVVDVGGGGEPWEGSLVLWQERPHVGRLPKEKSRLEDRQQSNFSVGSSTGLILKHCKIDMEASTSQCKVWYVNSSASSHITSHLEWLVIHRNLSESVVWRLATILRIPSVTLGMCRWPTQGSINTWAMSCTCQWSPRTWY